MAIVGEAEIRIRPDTDNFGRDVESGIGAGLRRAARLGVLAFASLGAAGATFGRKAIEEATELARVMGQTAAVIKSTGGAANVSQEQIKKLSDQLAAVAGVEGEVVQAGANMLLTFTNIQNRAGEGNDIFNQSVSVLNDLATALGTEPQQAAIQLGKALNDPIGGVTALRRVGVQFTDEQENLIKTLVESGNIMGAQKVILAELSKEFGGSAKAAGDARSPIEKLQLAFKDVAEAVGTALIPAVNKILPAIKPIIEGLGPTLGAIAQAIVPVLGAVATALLPFLNLLASLVSSVSGPLSAAFSALAGFFGAVGTAITPLIEGLGKLVAALLPGLTQVINALTPAITALAPVFAQVATILEEAIIEAVKELEPFLPEIAKAFADIVVAIAPLLPALVQLSLTLFGNQQNIQLLTFALQATAVIVQILAPFLNLIVGLFGGIGGSARTAEGSTKGLTDSFKWLTRIDLGFIKAIESVFDAVGRAIGRVIEKVKDVVRAFANFRLPDILTPGSPSPFEQSLINVSSTLAKVKTQFGALGAVTANLAIPAPSLGFAGASAAPVSSTSVTQNITVNQVADSPEATARKIGTELARDATR